MGTPFHGGDFFGFWGTKTRFWWVIKLELTSILAPNVYDDYSIRGGAFLLYVLDTSKGETVGTFWKSVC